MGKWIHRLTEVDLDAKTAICAECGPTELRVWENGRRCVRAMGALPPVTEYRLGEHRMLSRDLEAGTGVCFTCGAVTLNLRKGAWGCPGRRRRPDRLQMSAALRRAAREGKACGICGELDPDRTVLDHKHGTDEPRGVLCFKHNTGLGMFDDDPVLLEKAAEYLRKHV